MRLGKALRPTVKGIRLVDTLRRIHADRLASAELTGELEYELREVERGARTGKQFMAAMVEYTKEIVEKTKGFDYDDLYKDEPALGTCPCEKARPVWERTWFYRCEEDPNTEEDCTFRVWKDKSGRYMDRATVSLLLRKLETPVLDGFATRDGRTYPGILTLVGKELKLVSTGATGERASDEPEYEVNETPLGPCPTGCGSEVIETPTRFVCRAGAEGVAAEGKKPCPFVLPRTICKREITRDEALAYVANKRTEMLTDFTSRFGRPFSATLFVKDNGRHGFEFAPRKGRGEAAAGGASEAAPPKRGGRTPRAKAGGKTAGPKRSRKKSTPDPMATRVVRRKRGKRKGAGRRAAPAGAGDAAAD